LNRSTNDASRVRRELMIRVVREYLNGTLEKNIDRIPCELRPRNGKSSRCCIYKDRAVLKYRLMALLGIGIETETDEAKPLSEYYQDALKRDTKEQDILSVLDVACSHCVTSRYLITNACRGCFARPCTFACPRGAISVIGNQAQIDYAKCIDCGKCTQVCPYHAIIRVPVPCEEVCPVGAISRDEKGKQFINFDTCISCGKCMTACPFAAILERSQMIDILKHIQAGQKVIAMVAPSIIGQFTGSLGQIAAALVKAGFASMVEVAYGAEMTTEHEAKEFFERIGKGDRIMTTSCCPAYTEAVKRHVPSLQPFVSSTPSPMRFAAQSVKQENPDAITVFIGPCVAKRKEALSDANTDYVMTFEELGALLVAMEIDISSLDAIPLERDVKGYARGFATSCGVTAAILAGAAEQQGLNPEELPAIDAKFINGLDRKTVKLLDLYGKGKLPGNFLEVMACEGGCVGGPCAIGKVTLATEAVKKAAAEK